jgi:predicted permease
LARIQIRNGNGGFGITNDFYALTYPLLEQIRLHHQQAFSGVFGWRTYDDVRFGEGAQARRVRGLLVSGELFPALELRPAAGRLLNCDDDRPGCTASGVVLSYPFWQSQFGGRASAIGSKVMILDRPYEVVGVTPARFSGLEVGRKFDIAVPMCAAAIASPEDFTRRDLFWVTVMGRLKQGVSLRRASDQLQAISPGILEATLPSGYSARALETYKKFQLEAAPAGNGVSSLRDQYDTSLWLLLGITGLVLLIACANLGNLMLARAGARQREFAVRLALGASRGRLIRQSLAESLLVAAAGAALGLGLARALSQSIIWFLSTENDVPQLDLSADWRMLAFTTAVAMLACVIFGLAPALRCSQTEPGAAIKSGGRSVTEGRERFSFQRLLVVVQISVSLVLVVGALLFVGSFRNLMTLDGLSRKRDSARVFRHESPQAYRCRSQTTRAATARRGPLHSAGGGGRHNHRGSDWWRQLEPGHPCERCRRLVEVYLDQPWTLPNARDSHPGRPRFQLDRYGNVAQGCHREPDLCPPLLRRRQPDRQDVPHIA